MARSKSHEKDKEDTKPNRGPARYPYVVYASKGRGEDLRWLIEKFSHRSGARAMIESLREGADYVIKRGASDTWDYMLFEDGMRISLRDDKVHEEVMSGDYDEESRTTLASVLWFKHRQRPEPTGGEDLPDGTGDHGSKKSKRKADKQLQADKPRSNPDKQPKVSKPRVDKSGKISANDIAKELGIEGREVRGVLRSLGLTKPEGGWLFDEKTADDIRAKVKANHKKGKK